MPRCTATTTRSVKRTENSFRQFKTFMDALAKLSAGRTNNDETDTPERQLKDLVKHQKERRQERIPVFIFINEDQKDSFDEAEFGSRLAI